MLAGIDQQQRSAPIESRTAEVGRDPAAKMKVDSSVSGRTNGIYPPALPHVTDNLTPLSDALRRQAQFTYHELTTFMKSLEASTLSDNEKKRTFLELLVSLRENFIRLYVISKWACNANEIQKLIDLFAWLREQSQTITNALNQLGNMKQSLVSAKVPNPDISTALEVLVKGRPQLPTHNFLPAEKVPQQLILDTLKSLDIAISVKMALATQSDLPRQFYNYEVRDGRVIMDVHGSFECALSLASDASPQLSKMANESSHSTTLSPSLSELPFCLVDFKLGFRTENLKIVLSKTALPLQTFAHLERIANMELARNGLIGLHGLLHEYSLSCKLFMLHRQLLKLRMGLWRGHLSHTYNAEHGLIVIMYWLKRRGASSRIEIGRARASEGGEVDNGTRGDVTTSNLGLRWMKEDKVCDSRGVKLVEEDGSIDIEHVIRSIINIHIDDELKELKSKLLDSVENAERFCHIEQHDLVFDVNHRRTVIYNINLLSGQGCFQHPTPGMTRIVAQINRNPGSNAFVGLLRLRLLTQDLDLTTVLSTTGWTSVPGIQMSLKESGLDADLSQLKNRSLAPQLAALRFFRRKGWPKGFFLVVAVFGFSTKPQFWISRLIAAQGSWKVQWAGSVNPPHKVDQSQQYSFSGLKDLAGVCTSMLVCHLIVKELQEMQCKVKRLHPETDTEAAKFVKHITGDVGRNSRRTANDLASNSASGATNEVDGEVRNDASLSVLLISNKSLYAIPNVRDSLLLVASIDSAANLQITIYGNISKSSKLDILAKSLNGISSMISEHTAVNLDQVSRIFTIRSSMNLRERWLSQERTKPISDTPPASLSDLDDTPASASTILSGPLTVLRQLSGLLSLFQLISSDSKLKLQSVALDRVSFQYGERPEESITLRLKTGAGIPDTPDGDIAGGFGNNNESVSIELAEGNPHALCLARLKQLISSGFNYEKIRLVIVYLRLTLPLYRVYASLLKESETQLEEFNKKNADPGVPVSKMELIPSQGFSLSLYQMEMLKVIYYKLVAKKSDKKQKFQRLVCGLRVQLRHKYHRMSLNGSVCLITLSGPFETDSSGLSTSQSTSSSTISDSSDASLRTAYTGISKFMGWYFSGEKQVPVSSSDSDGELPIIYLKTGLVCKSIYLEQVLRFLHTKMLEALVSEK